MFRRVVDAAWRWKIRLTDEVGQTTAEYALVIVGAAALGALLLTWAAKSDAIGKLFDVIIGQVKKMAK